ncbi:unnamed protein product [Litomosoides sigmodontis]|uniref:MIF4G domain-containing protein n=1 Tax=Litomosoides sigmodontis TaxID=42156 RepID=A0A3P6V1Q8_LITSI|nr:unnamed protein product [Litomosoides sigmodontis]
MYTYGRKAGGIRKTESYKVMTSNVTVPTTAAIIPSERRSKRPSTRPAIQIYRPPELVTNEDESVEYWKLNLYFEYNTHDFFRIKLRLRGNDENSTNTKPNQTAGAKQLKKDTVKKQSEENNHHAMESGKCANTLDGCMRKSTDSNNLLKDVAAAGAQAEISLQRSDSALSNESMASSQTSTKSPNSISNKHLHRNETVSPSNHHHHHQQQQQQQQQSQHYQSHHHRHQSQSQATNFKQHLKRSSGSSSGGSSNNSSNNNNGAINSQASSLLQTDVSTGSICITSGVQRATATAITGGGNSGNSGSGLNNTSLRKSTVTTKEQQQQSASKKKQLNGKEIEELAAGLRKLNLKKENSLIEQFITSNFEDDQIGGAVGQILVHFSIEENRQAGKAVARIAAQLLNFDTASVFYQGITVALMHYFECRDRLRIDHFRVWITFLNFVSDLYASVGYIYEGELVDLVFRIFGYLLRAPILDTLKIEELESLIGCLLSVGYDLERQCPEQLAILKDLIRDAFIEVQEPWARKMILLLMELGASGWKLPPEANEYYFQHTSS